MTDTLLFAAALPAAIVAVSIGSARIVSWLLDRRDYTASQHSREAAFVAQARAELAASGWTAEDEAAFQAVRSRQDNHLRALHPEFQRLLEESRHA